MDEKKFLNDLEELLDCDRGSLSLEQTLMDTGKWDSLNFVGFLEMAHSKYGVKVAPAELRACKTLRSLAMLVHPK